MRRQERVGRESQARGSALVGQYNGLAAQLVDVVVEVLDAGAWGGGEGLRSPEHWLSWRAGFSASRARGNVQIARRVDELPLCVGLFQEGRLNEESMALIAAKAPGGRDGELADLAPKLLTSQLSRILDRKGGV